jgi:hypothetical protein
MNLKGRRFETVSDIQRESQAALEKIKQNDFQGAFKARKNGRVLEYVPKETILKMQPKWINLSQHFFLTLKTFIYGGTN